MLAGSSAANLPQAELVWHPGPRPSAAVCAAQFVGTLVPTPAPFGAEGSGRATTHVGCAHAFGRAGAGAAAVKEPWISQERALQKRPTNTRSLLEPGQVWRSFYRAVRGGTALEVIVGTRNRPVKTRNVLLLLQVRLRQKSPGDPQRALQKSSGDPQRALQKSPGDPQRTLQKRPSNMRSLLQVNAGGDT